VATAADPGQSTLTSVEQALIEHVACGDVLDLAGDRPVDEAAMRAWDDTRTISATVIRDILRGRHVYDPDPHGLRLRGARIDGRLDVGNITSTIGIELTDCLLDHGVNARDATLFSLVLSGCRLSHPTEPPLDAERLTTTVLILDRVTSNAHSPRGAVGLVGAHFGGLDCSGARLVNDSGPALQAEGLQVDRNVFLRAGFEATGSGELGAVRLVGAHLGGLECDGARLVNDSGPALHAEGLQVDQSVFLRAGFEATGSGELGAVGLLGAHLGGLDCSGARLVNDSGPALQAQRLQVDHNVFLSAGFEATGSGGTDVVLDLRYAEIGGVLVFNPTTLDHLSVPHRKLDVEGLTYIGLPRGITPAAWLALLRNGTPTYTAQPYQHLAAAHRAAGHDREARRVLIAQRRDQIHRHALTSRTERTWARLTGVFLGYGYKPWRALIALTAVLTTAVLAAIILGGSHGALAQTPIPPPPATPTPCTWTDHIGVGLDLGTPLITTGTRTHCDTTNTPAGRTLTLIGWTLRLLAWAFATLFIAGFTGAVRKT
jgi:hypothetical protein